MGSGSEIQAKTPEASIRASGAKTRISGGSQGMLVVFMTTDQLRLYGPMGLRLWLERNRPPRAKSARPAQVVEFNGGPLHAATLGEGEG